MGKKQSSRTLIKKSVEAGLKPQATTDFESERLKKRIRLQVRQDYPKFLAKKLLKDGTPPRQAHSQVTWALKVDFGMGMKAAEGFVDPWGRPEMAARLNAWQISDDISISYIVKPNVIISDKVLNLKAAR